MKVVANTIQGGECYRVRDSPPLHPSPIEGEGICWRRMGGGGARWVPASARTREGDGLRRWRMRLFRLEDAGPILKRTEIPSTLNRSEAYCAKLDALEWRRGYQASHIGRE